jgi:hypothetical protein
LEASLRDVNLASGGSDGLDGVMVEGRGLPLLDGERAGGTYSQTKACAIAELLLQHLGFAIHQFDGSLGAGGDANPTSVTQLLVYADYLADDHG